ncbi:MAG: YihY/virulence factor BrkB family protein [Bacilli bacterium]|nr:YihY/virulence factor BrkB family protein [Bacilli bacterium]MDD4808597.1 YihY/virulence factor BrkB family protein [Bacilli bacterium]
MKQVEKLIKQFIKTIKKPEMRILPGQLAYFLVLSIIPIITLFAFMGSLFDVSIHNITPLLKETVPKGVYDLLMPFFTVEGLNINTGFSMVIGFLVASNGAHSIIVTSNTLYKIESNNYLRSRIKAFFLIFLLIVLFIFILMGLAFGNVLLKFLLNMILTEAVASTIYVMFVYLKWPVALIVVFLMIKLIYTLAPDSKISSKYVNVGAAFATLGLLFVTFIYSFYSNNIARYNIFYGNLANIIVLMIWVYTLAYVIVLGMALNTEYYHLENNATNKKDDNCS